MVARALIKYIKISTKKLAPVASIVSRKKVAEALSILVNVNKKGASILQKAIGSALNNAKRIPEKKYNESNLYISKLVVNEGPTLKRFRAMSLGRAGKIRKRTCHILVELDAIKEPASQKSEKPAQNKEKNTAKVKKLVKVGKK